MASKSDDQFTYLTVAQKWDAGGANQPLQLPDPTNPGAFVPNPLAWGVMAVAQRVKHTARKRRLYNLLQGIFDPKCDLYDWIEGAFGSGAAAAGLGDEFDGCLLYDYLIEKFTLIEMTIRNISITCTRLNASVSRGFLTIVLAEQVALSAFYTCLMVGSRQSKRVG